MSEFLNRTFYGNTVTEWAIAFAIVVGAVLVGKTLYWITNRIVKRATAKTKMKLDDILIDMAEEPLVFGMTVAGLWFGFNTLNMPEGMETFAGRVFAVLITITIAWALTRLADALLKEYVAPIVSKTEGDLDDHLLPIAQKGIKLAIWSIAIIIGMDNAGYDVGAILAGLGIGGLAFALAAQDTVSNLFGGFTILMDKPFAIHERIKIDNFDGTVTEIGLRSTRLQTLEGRTVTIPNSTFTQNPIENVSSEPARKVVLDLGLTYDTDDKGIEKAMELLRQIADANENVRENPTTAFSAFGDFALNVKLIYHIKPGADIFETQTEMNLEILRKFAAAGLDFAFPSQTIYTKQI